MLVGGWSSEVRDRVAWLLLLLFVMVEVAVWSAKLCSLTVSLFFFEPEVPAFKSLSDREGSEPSE